MKATRVCATVLGLAVSALAIPSHAGTPCPALLGERAPEAAAARTIVITPDTKYVNVEGGETVRFVVGERAFAWNFNGSLIVDMVELNRVVPPDILNHKVRAFVAPDPRYLD
ncbi:CzcE family metal-binding protein [Massilia niastensis]|uniref:CzcE family metal-binding protein n=1 Tax=Massilia niastensis TaxID=544911 RepID=UPI000376FE24|nr:CzcE family metal-binding protein [Massilia niastensis]